MLPLFSSSIVLKSLTAAHKAGKDFRVIVVDSRPTLEGTVGKECQCVHACVCACVCVCGCGCGCGCVCLCVYECMLYTPLTGPAPQAESVFIAWSRVG